MASANPYWGAPRIHGELLKLGIEISERTVSRLVPKNRKPPSQTWRAFLNNYVTDLVAIDFFTAPTATFRVWVAKTSLALNSGKLVAVVKQAAGDRSSVRLAERLTLALSPHAFFADHRYGDSRRASPPSRPEARDATVAIARRS
jgi:hypothetical protein